MHFYKALTLLFVYLRLTGHIDWSFWLVASPMWSMLILELLSRGLDKATVWAEKRAVEEAKS